MMHIDKMDGMNDITMDVNLLNGEPYVHYKAHDADGTYAIQARGAWYVQGKTLEHIAAMTRELISRGQG